MPKPSDELLVAYVDGELDAAARAEIEIALAHDAELRARVAGLQSSAQILRTALDTVLREPVPERLLAAARGQGDSTVVDFAAAQQKHRSRMPAARPWMQWAAVAGIVGLMVGGGAGYFASRSGNVNATTANLASANWLDNIAGYHKLFVNAGADDLALLDVPANDSDAAHKAVQKLPSDFRLPNLQPWGLQFQGARYLIVEGQPATQLFYTTDNKALGPLTVVVGTTNRPDLAPTFDRRGDLNVLYWRHHGHAYALVGTADIGYLWNISNDIEYQLDAI
jgi:anti-sigma factor RsiW